MARTYEEFLEESRNGGADDAGYRNFLATQGGWTEPVRTTAPTQVIPEKPSPWRRVPDIGVTGLKGAVGFVESGIGLADIPTGGAVGRGLEKAGLRTKDAQEMLSEMYSPQQKVAEAAKSAGFREGFMPGMSAALRNPSTIATAIGESIPSMLGGAAAARGLLKAAPKMAPWAAGAVGEGVVGMGSAAEQIRQQSEDGYLSPKGTISAIGSGLGTSLFGAVGGKLASKYDLGDVETALARGTVGKSDKGFIRRVVGSGISEGVLEELPQSVQEQMWQNYATDRPLTEGLGEAAGMGMLAGIGMGATVGALTKRRDLTKPAAPVEGTPPPEAQPLLQLPYEEARVRVAMPDGSEMEMSVSAAKEWEDVLARTGGVPPNAPKPTIDSTTGMPVAPYVSPGEGQGLPPTGAAAGYPTKQDAVKTPSVKITKAQRLSDEWLGFAPEDDAAFPALDELSPALKKTATRALGALGSAPQKGKAAEKALESFNATRDTIYAAHLKEQALAPAKAAFVEAGGSEGRWTALTNKFKDTEKLVAHLSKAITSTSSLSTRTPAAYQAAHDVLVQGQQPATPLLESAPTPDVLTQPESAAKKEIAPVTITTPEGVSVVQPEIRKGDRSRKAEVGAALRPVATDPVPVAPASEEEVPAYEAAVAKYVVSGIPQNEWLAVARVRAAEQDDPEVIGESFEAAAKALGVSKTSVRDRFNKGLSKMKANALAAGLDWDSVAELLNIATPQAEVASIGEAGQEGGRRAAVAPSDDFEPTFGTERVETAGEEGAVVEEGEAIETAAEEVDIDAGAALDVQVADTFERALAAYPEEYAQMAETIWGAGFSDLPGVAQVRFVRDVADMSRDANGDVVAFEAGVARLKGDRDGKKYTYDLAETVQSSDEIAAGQPESTGRGGRGDGSPGVVTGAKGAAGVKVAVKKRRVASEKPEGVRFNRGATQGVASTHSLAAAQQMVSNIVGRWKTKPKKVAVDNFASLRPETQKWLSDNKAKAYFDRSTGELLIASDLHSSLSDVKVSLFHEGLGHFGLLENFKGELDTFLQEVYDTSPEFRKIVDAYKATTGMASTVEAAEEVLAKSQEGGKIPQRVWDRLVAWVRSYLRKNGVWVKSYTMNDLVAILRHTNDVVVDGDRTIVRDGTAKDGRRARSSSGGEASIVSAIKEMGEQRGVGTEAIKYAAMMPFTRDLTKWASKYMKSASGFWDAMTARLEDTTRWSLATEKVLQQFLDLSGKSVGNAPSSQDKVQKFLFDGKMDGAWGFQPEWIKDPVPVSSAMKQKWAALTPVERDAAKAVLKLFNELRKADIAAVRASVENFRKYADTLKDPETKKDIEDDVALKLKQMKTLAEYRGPYVPTMRFGDYAVEAKSNAYLSAEANGDEAAMAKMKSDEAHYFYGQFKSQQEANAAKAKIESAHKGMFVRARPKFGHPVGKKADFSALIKIEGLMRKYTDKKGAGEVRSLLNTLMSDLSEEYSEVQSRQMFKAVSGAQWNEVMQGVAIRGKQMAFKIAALNHNRTISNKLFDMRDEADKSPDSATAIHLWNEMEKRHTNSMDGEEINESVQNIMGAVSFWKLLTNPMYFITQLMQPYQYSIPSMMKAGLGYTDSWRAMWDVKETVLEVFKQSKMVKSVAEDLSWAGKAHGKDVQEMLEWLQARNLLDMGINSEVGALEDAHIIKQNIERHAIRPLRNAVQNVELINRITTAIATYQLALKKTGSKEQARSITENVIADSHGLYAGMNAPRYLNQKDWRRIPVQFRKFQLIQATFLYRNLVQELGKIKDPTERAAAMRTIAATLGHTLVVAGLKGSVLWLVVSGLMSLAGLGGDDEDDPRTNEEKAYAFLTDEYSPGFANFVMRGAPTTAGIDISARTAMNPLTVLPFDNNSLFSALSSRKAFQESVYTLAGGAFGGLSADMVDGFDMMREGNWYKGAEKLSPLGIKNVLQAARYSTEGVSQRNGVVTMTPEELDWWDITQQALGAPPEVIKSAQRKRTQLHDTMEAFAERQKELKLDYQQARDDGDTDAVQKIRGEWSKMVSTMRGLGIKPPKTSSLVKRQEPDVVGGVTVTKQTRRYLESMG